MSMRKTGRDGMMATTAQLQNLAAANSQPQRGVRAILEELLGTTGELMRRDRGLEDDPFRDIPIKIPGLEEDPFRDLPAPNLPPICPAAPPQPGNKVPPFEDVPLFEDDDPRKDLHKNPFDNPIPPDLIEPPWDGPKFEDPPPRRVIHPNSLAGRPSPLHNLITLAGRTPLAGRMGSRRR